MNGDASPQPSVLVVEDDRQLAAMLAELLGEEGYRVQAVHDGQRGLHFGLTGHFDALIVDRGLPVVEGLDLVRALRTKGVATPVLVLTARGAVSDRVEGLDAGAEDYLVKPFEITEFLARVRALLRRGQVPSETSIAVGSRRLVVATRTVTDPAGARLDVQLSDRECALLALLARSPEQVFTRGQILDRIFEGATTAGTVDTYVHYLRRRLGRDIIRTVHGLGYRLGTP